MMNACFKASPTVFSAGLDIMEMYKPDMKRVEEFWTTLQQVWVKLFGANFITAAAINVCILWYSKIIYSNFFPNNIIIVF